MDFIEEEDIVTYEDFDCGNTFYPETPTKIRQINREQNYISSSRENSKCIHSNDRHNCFIDEQHNSNIFLNPMIYGTWFQQILCHSITLKIDTLCPVSTLNQQLNNLEQSQIRCSLHCEGWTVKGRDCASALHSFRFFLSNYLPDGRVNETFATVEELSTIWKPGAMDGIPPFVMICNCI